MSFNGDIGVTRLVLGTKQRGWRYVHQRERLRLLPFVVGRLRILIRRDRSIDLALDFTETHKAMKVVEVFGILGALVSELGNGNKTVNRARGLIRFCDTIAAIV